MLRGMVPALEKHHNVRILDEGLAAAVKFSHRYLAGPPVARQSGQRAGYGVRAAGAGPERDAAGDRRRHAADRRSRGADARAGAGSGAGRRSQRSGWRRSPNSKARRGSALAELKARWEKERDLVDKIREVRGKLEAGIGAAGSAGSAATAAAPRSRHGRRGAARGTGRS